MLSDYLKVTCSSLSSALLLMTEFFQAQLKPMEIYLSKHNQYYYDGGGYYMVA